MDPFSQSHQEAVELFQRHFDLTRSRSELEDLRLLLRHYSKIPYENISKIIKVASHADLEAKFRFPLEVIQDHIEHCLGGTCFSLTYFLEQILLLRGYACHKAMAHMSAGENIHCVIVVALARYRYLVDPGYLLWEPLLLSPQVPQVCFSPQGGVEVRYDPAANQFHLFTFNARGRRWRYRFTDEPVAEEEFRQHWIASFSKPTLHNILLNQLTEKGLLYIRGNHLRLTSFEEERKANIRQKYHRQVQDFFGIEPQWVEEALSILRRQRQEWMRQKAAGTEGTGIWLS